MHRQRFKVILRRVNFFCSILAAPPTAELEPLKDGEISQTDEVKLNNVFFSVIFTVLVTYIFFV